MTIMTTISTALEAEIKSDIKTKSLFRFHPNLTPNIEIGTLSNAVYLNGMLKEIFKNNPELKHFVTDRKNFVKEEMECWSKLCTELYLIDGKKNTKYLDLENVIRAIFIFRLLFNGSREAWKILTTNIDGKQFPDHINYPKFKEIHEFIRKVVGGKLSKVEGIIKKIILSELYKIPSSHENGIYEDSLALDRRIECCKEPNMQIIWICKKLANVNDDYFLAAPLLTKDFYKQHCEQYVRKDVVSEDVEEAAVPSYSISTIPAA